MSQFTNEFSVCLNPDQQIARRVSDFRNELPASPYRDDPPHLTLLRGISTTSFVSDSELANLVRENLVWDDIVQATGTVVAVDNINSSTYGSTSLLVIKPNEALAYLRKNFCKKLIFNGLFIEEDELNELRPQHITLRLGVPVAGKTLEVAQHIFMGQKVLFSSWLIYRLMLEGDQRIMHEVGPFSNT